MLRLPQRSGADLLTAWRLQREARAEERRRQPRLPVHIAAQMNAGGVERQCTVLDISASGARIAVPDPKNIPDRILVRIHGLIHRCRVIWRSDCEMGVEFVDAD
jgi:hypothetical protein